LIEIIFHLTTS